MPDEPMVRTTPQLLLDRYEVGPLLGSGGMAEVFEGRDRLLARRVAIKVLLSQYARDPSFLARFKREAQAAASLSHPNIVGIFDSGAQEQVNFIVMEYVEGRTLRDALREIGAFNPARAAEVGEEICAALAAAHARGLIHRDIKPGNVMLTPDGKVKVMDFGIARATTSDTITQTQAVIGTAQYISPEQAQGQAVDFRSDIYSLGCCVYEMLSGHVPFTGATPVAIAYRHVREAPTPLRQVNPGIPPSLEAVVMKALAKNPANRYQTAAEFRIDLARSRSGQPVEATPLLDPSLAVSAAPPPSRFDAQPTQVVAPVLTRPGPTRYGDGLADDLGVVPPRRGSSAWPWVAATLLAILLGAIAGYFVVHSMVTSSPTSPTTAPLPTAPPATQPPPTQPPPSTAPPTTAAATTTAPPTTAPPTTVAQGLVPVPDVTGEQRDMALRQLANAGLQPQAHPLLVNDPRQRGRVVFTQPAAGSTVPRGAVVAVFIGRLG